MQRIGKHDEVAELAEEHEQIVVDALVDGLVTPTERKDMLRSARAVRVATLRQATRIRISLRMIRGGDLDRGVCQEIADYRRLRLQEETSDGGNRAEVRRYRNAA